MTSVHTLYILCTYKSRFVPRFEKVNPACAACALTFGVVGRLPTLQGPTSIRRAPRPCLLWVKNTLGGGGGGSAPPTRRRRVPPVKVLRAAPRRRTPHTHRGFPRPA